MDLAPFASRARTLLLYALCGGGGVVLDFILYGLLIHVGIHYQVANAVGYATGTLLSFTLNRVFTFKVFDNPVRRLVIFVAVAAAGLSVSWLVLLVLVGQLGLHPLLAKAATLLIVLAFQFTLNSAVTFRSHVVPRQSVP